MRGRHTRTVRKSPRQLALRGAAALLLAAALGVSSFSSVTANTVSANVIDGDQSYTFNMASDGLDQILAQAQERGMQPLGPLDVAEQVENTTTVVIRRGVELEVKEAGKETSLTAYKGDTVEQALLENGIVLGEDDEVAPGREAVISGDATVEIRRSCQVLVYADGQTHTVTLVGGTVADALEEAGVTVGAEDTLNYQEDKPLFDKMHVRVTRMMEITVTADGETQTVETSAQTVEAALEKAGIQLGENDRVEPALTEKVTEGMAITVKRVEVREEKASEDIPFGTVYEDTDALYQGETETKSAGANGQKEVTYQVTLVDGVEESRQAVSENVVAQPVDEVVLRGTAPLPEPEPETSVDVSGGNGTGTSAGTFVDMYGNVVSYSSVMSGPCTAYSVPGGTTSLGWDAVYGVVAVNPNIIPYGTKMYITSPDGSVVYGYGVAGDTGGAAMAGTILADLCYNTVEECSQIGRREMVIYILS